MDEFENFGFFRWLLNTKVQILIISLLSVVVYFNTLPNQLVWDDHRFIEEWKNIRSFKSIPGYFKGDYAPRHDGKYRPIKGVVLTVNHSLWKENPVGYHIQAILIHLAATILVWAIAREVLKRKIVAFFSSSIFAVHPIHVEAITFITSSSDILGIVFLLLGFLIYIKKDDIAWSQKWILSSTIALAVLSYLTNEIALVLFPLFVIYDICFRKLSPKNIKEFWSFYLPHLLVVGVYLFFRFFILKITEDSNYVIDQLNITYLIMFEVIGKYIKLLILPINLSINNIIRPDIYALKRDIDPALSLAKLLDTQMIVWMVSVVLLLGIAGLLIRKAPVISFSILWFFVSLVPILNIFPLPALMTERYVYLASVGYCFLVGAGLGWFFYNKKVLSTKVVSFVIFVIIILFYSLLTIQRNSDWKDGFTLWSKTASQVEKSMVVQANLANAYLSDKKDYKRAIEHFLIASKFDYYNNTQVKRGLAVSYFKDNQIDNSKEQFLKILEIDSRFGEAHYYLGIIASNQKNTDEAILHYKSAIELSPELYDSYINLGKIYFEEKKYDDAIRIFQKAKLVSPENGESYNNLAVIYSKLGKIDEAISELRKSIELDPDDSVNKSNLKMLENFKKANAR